MWRSEETTKMVGWQPTLLTGKEKKAVTWVPSAPHVTYNLRQ